MKLLRPMLWAALALVLTACPPSAAPPAPSCGGPNGTLPTGSTNVPSPPVVVPLTGCTLIDYSLPITIGGQANVNVIADSGSTVLALAASNCTNCTAITPTYPVSHGTELCGTIASTYGDGTGWVGPSFQDNITVGSLPVVVDDFVAISSQEQSQSSGQYFFSNADCNLGTNGTNSSQGIMGLAFSGLTFPPAVGFLDAEQGQLNIPNVFATQLCMSGGQIWFGGYDATFTASAVQYTPVTPPSGGSGMFYWVTVNDMQVGGVSIGAQTYTTPIVDTGTSIAVLPPNVFEAIQNALAGNGAFQTLVGMSNAATWFSNGNCVNAGPPTSAGLTGLPTMTVVYPGVNSGPAISVTAPATLSYLDYHQDVGGNYYYCPGIAPNPSSSDLMIIGGSFLRGQITIFDRTNLKVGFATGKNCSS